MDLTAFSKRERERESRNKSMKELVSNKESPEERPGIVTYVNRAHPSLHERESYRYIGTS